MAARERVAGDEPRNAGVLAWLAAAPRAAGHAVSGPRGTLDDHELGAHPDIVGFLWDELDAALPKRCAWIVHGTAALVRKDSGLVFGLALGTVGTALRIPLERQAELGITPEQKHHRHRNGVVLDLAPCGPEWALAPYGEPGKRWGRIAHDGAA